MHEDKKDPILEGRLTRQRIYSMLSEITSVRLATKEAIILSDINKLLRKLTVQSHDDFKDLESIKSLGKYRVHIIGEIKEKYKQLQDCSNTIHINDMAYPLRDAYGKSWYHFIEWMMSEILKHDILPNADEIYQKIIDDTERSYQISMNSSMDIYEDVLEGIIEGEANGAATP